VPDGHDANDFMQFVDLVDDSIAMAAPAIDQVAYLQAEAPALDRYRTAARESVQGVDRSLEALEPGGGSGLIVRRDSRI
jgi:hypothetical protein